jgi:hypothetical protein
LVSRIGDSMKNDNKLVLEATERKVGDVVEIITGEKL